MQFFSKYSLSRRSQQPPDEWGNQIEEAMAVTGQLLTKSLLSILKHRTVEKTVERCEMSIIEGPQDEIPDEDQDSLESKLIVRLHCKHGVIKTHRLLLLTPTSLMAPGIPDNLNESNLTIGPKALKDMIEHFPLARGAKSDPQLIWSFGESEVELRSLESSVDTRGKAQLATELTISAEEFDVYNIYAPPTTIAFHLREFNATIAFADSMSLSLDLRFTDPAAPLFIDVEGDNSEILFVISTSQVHGAVNGAPSQQYQPPNNKKRERQKTPAESFSTKKPIKAAQRVGKTDAQTPRTPGSVAPQIPTQEPHDVSMGPPQVPPNEPSQPLPREPLFWPGSSQLSIADEAVIRSTGLGIEDMDMGELENMLEGEGEEVAFDFFSQRIEKVPQHDPVERDLECDNPGGERMIEAAELAPTQTPDTKMFQPLFED